MLFNFMRGLMPKMYLAEGEGDPAAGGGGGGKAPETVTISKAELDEIKGTVDTLKTELSDTQTNLLDPDFLEWQANRGKGGKGDDDGSKPDPTPAKPAEGDLDPFKDFTDEQLENMSPRKQAQLIQKTLVGNLVPAIADNLSKSLIPKIKGSIQSEQEASHDKKVVEELRALAKEGKDIKAVKAEMMTLAELHPDWDTKRVYTESVKLKRAMIISDGRELTDKEKKALALAEPDKPTTSGGGPAVPDESKNFKSDTEAADDAYEKAFGKV